VGCDIPEPNVMILEPVFNQTAMIMSMTHMKCIMIELYLGSDDDLY